MDVEYYIIQMEINMKLNGKLVTKMDMEYIIFIILIGNIKKNWNMEFLMDLEFYIFLKDWKLNEIGI